jgi:hypothetical protein
LVNTPPWDEAETAKLPITVSTLFTHLKALGGRERCRVPSGTWREIDDEHVVRIDWPFDGIAHRCRREAVARLVQPSESNYF